MNKIVRNIHHREVLDYAYNIMYNDKNELIKNGD